MTKEQLNNKVQQEIIDFVNDRKSLQLSSLLADGTGPYSSYAPFAVGDDCLYILISEIAIHASNLLANGSASVLIIEDEDTAQELFARKRVNYQVDAKHIVTDEDEWNIGIAALAQRHGTRIDSLSQLEDFKLFRLTPKTGRYVKGFGKAFAFRGESLCGEFVNHLREGHKKRDVA